MNPTLCASYYTFGAHIRHMLHWRRLSCHSCTALGFILCWTAIFPCVFESQYSTLQSVLDKGCVLNLSQVPTSAALFHWQHGRITVNTFAMGSSWPINHVHIFFVPGDPIAQETFFPHLMSAPRFLERSCLGIVRTKVQPCGILRQYSGTLSKFKQDAYWTRYM